MSDIRTVASRLEKHRESVVPGQPHRWTSANQPGDWAAQGDLALEMVAAAPPDYILVPNPTDADRKLVPGGEQGSHHILRDLDGVTMYRPPNWGEDPSDLRGPCLVFSTPNAIEHCPGTSTPHGTHFIDSPLTLLLSYQQNLDVLEQATRALD